MNEKNCFDAFVAGFGFGVGGLSLVASSRRPRRLPWPLQLKIKELLRSRNPWILKQAQDPVRDDKKTRIKPSRDAELARMKIRLVPASRLLLPSAHACRPGFC